MRPGTFDRKGINSSNFNIVAQSINRPMIPAMTPKILTVPGMHGVHDFGVNTYSNQNIPVHIAFVGNDIYELMSRADEIAAWLTSKKYEPLTFADEPNVYYLAKIYDKVALEKFKRFGEADINFDCMPFKIYQESSGKDLTWDSDLTWGCEYTWGSADDYKVAVTANTTFDIEYFGTQELGFGDPAGSQFDIVITGSFTTLSITLNDKTINYNEAIANETVTINNIKATIKKGIENKLPVCSGDLDDFLRLIPGTNTATITGTGLNCSVLFDFRPQFL